MLDYQMVCLENVGQRWKTQRKRSMCWIFRFLGSCSPYFGDGEWHRLWHYSTKLNRLPAITMGSMWNFCAVIYHWIVDTVKHHADLKPWTSWDHPDSRCSWPLIHGSIAGTPEKNVWKTPSRGWTNLLITSTKLGTWSCLKPCSDSDAQTDTGTISWSGPARWDHEACRWWGSSCPHQTNSPARPKKWRGPWRSFPTFTCRASRFFRGVHRLTPQKSLVKKGPGWQGSGFGSSSNWKRILENAKIYKFLCLKYLKSWPSWPMQYLILIGKSWKNSSSPQYVPRLGRKISHSSGWLSHPKFWKPIEIRKSQFLEGKTSVKSLNQPLEFRMVKNPHNLSVTGQSNKRGRRYPRLDSKTPHWENEMRKSMTYPSINWHSYGKSHHFISSEAETPRISRAMSVYTTHAQSYKVPPPGRSPTWTGLAVVYQQSMESHWLGKPWGHGGNDQ